jgi:hypothetical protein
MFVNFRYSMPAERALRELSLVKIGDPEPQVGNRGANAFSALAVHPGNVQSSKADPT